DTKQEVGHGRWFERVGQQWQSLKINNQKLQQVGGNEQAKPAFVHDPSLNLYMPFSTYYDCPSAAKC
ncbi:MAG: hypothetical protein AAGU32_19335, partial [Bacillota bacterium]